MTATAGDLLTGVRIGPVRLRNRLVLASMEEHTDRPFRRLCREFGASLVITEMVPPDRLLAGDRLAERQLAYGPDERPIAGQLLGGTLEDTVAAARLIAARGFDLVLLARGALGNPWIFSRTLGLAGGRVLPAPSREDRAARRARYLKDEAHQLGLRRPDGRLVRLALYFGKDLDDFARLKELLRAARSLNEFFEALKVYFRGR